MSDRDELLALLDDVLRLAAGSPANRIEIEAEDLGVTVVRASTLVAAKAASAPAGEAKAPEHQRVHSSGVGIFSSAKAWAAGDAVTKGTVLGSVQSLGAMTDVVAPIDGVLHEVLVAGGAPVEYGQPLFAIAKR